MEGASLPVIATLGFVVLTGEAIVFTILPTELSARFLRNGLWGLVAGIIAYSPVLHASNGVAGIVFSAWIILVIGVVYYLQHRKRANPKNPLQSYRLSTSDEHRRNALKVIDHTDHSRGVSCLPEAPLPSGRCGAGGSGAVWRRPPSR